MPIPTETLRNTGRLNIIFAVSAVLSLAAMLWMLEDDHERRWRDYQRDYFNNRAALAHFDVLKLTSDAAVKDYDQAKQRLADEEARLGARSAELARLRQLETDTAGRLQGAAADFGNLNAEFQVTLFEFEEHKTLHGPDHPSTKKTAAKVEEQTSKLKELQKIKESLEDQLAEARAELKKMQGPVEAARKAVTDYEKQLADARQQESMYGKGLRRTSLNIPLLDFAAPKGTAGREEIRQVVLPDVRQNYNFLESYTVDRCTTCHNAIDRPDQSLESFIAKAEGALLDVNAARVKANQPPLVVAMRDASKSGPHGEHDGGTNGHAADVATNGDAPKTWPPVDQMTTEQRKAYLSAMVETLNGYLESEGREKIRFEQPLLAHPRLDLFVSPDSPHPMSRMGCTACHEGNGQETDFMYAAHTPANHHQAEEWEDKYVNVRWGIPEATFHLIEEYWDRPMMAAKYTEAMCAKCHTQVSDLASYRGDGMANKLTRGRTLFTQIGCANCHLAEGLGDTRRVGPDLTHVKDKLDTGFMHRWIYYPRDFRPATFMPHFFHQENNLPSSANEYDPQPVLRTQTEVAAITHYLETFSSPFTPEPLPEGMTGDAKAGWEKFTSLGCLACHSSLNTVDPSDEKGRTFGQRWIERELVHQGRSTEEAGQQFAKMDLNARIDFAMQHFSTDRHAAAKRKLEELRSMGEDTSELYVPPEFTRFAPELSGLATKLVSNPEDAQQLAHGRQWIYNWLHDPRHYHAEAKMPRLFTDNYYWRERDLEKRDQLARQDMLDVAEYLLTLRHDTFKPEPLPLSDQNDRMAGNLIMTLLAGQYTEGEARRILSDQKRYPEEEYGPLTAAVVKQAERSIGKEEAVHRIASQDLRDRQMLFLGQKMITHYGCYACHTIPGFETASRPGTELTVWGEKRLAQLDFAFFSPGMEQLREEKPDEFGMLYPLSAEFEHLHAANGNEEQHIVHNRGAFAYHKLRNPRIWDRGKIKKPYDKLKMPNFYLSPADTDALVTYLLSRTQSLVAKTLQVDYQSTPLGGVAAGRHLTTELNCVGCHKIEDNEPVVQQYKIVDDPSGGIMVDELNLPPWLHGQGAKVSHNWLHGFLRQVEMLRPWLNIRMPMFYLDDHQTTTIVKYFANATQDESADVMRRLAEVHGFQQKVNRAAELSKPAAGKSTEAATNGDAASGSEPSRPPGDFWFLDAGLRLARDYVRDYAVRYKLVRPSAIDPKDNDADSLADAYVKASEGAEFLGTLYDVKYPFGDAVRPRMSAARFELGEHMLRDELKCLACHVLGDLYAEGANKNPSAPNLGLTYRRLSRDWLRSWLQYPGKIQPGTKMPQWWGKGGTLDSLPEADLAEFTKKYGPTPEEQMTLLEDFIYEAGYRNHTLIPSAEPVVPEAEEGEAGEADEGYDEFAEEAATQPAKDESKQEEEEFEP